MYESLRGGKKAIYNLKLKLANQTEDAESDVSDLIIDEWHIRRVSEDDDIKRCFIEIFLETQAVDLFVKNSLLRQLQLIKSKNISNVRSSSRARALFTRSLIDVCQKVLIKYKKNSFRRKKRGLFLFRAFSRKKLMTRCKPMSCHSIEIRMKNYQTLYF